MSELFKKTTHAVFWSTVDVFMRYGLQFVVLIALAHLLTPKDFGVIAMLGLFVSLGTIFIDSGFSAALIQRQRSTPVDESSVFFFNLCMGVTIALVLVALAPFIAEYFKEPLLHPLSYAMAANLFVSSLGSIHTTLLSREMNFKLVAKISGVSSVLSGTVAITMASQGFGVWSLAAQTLTASVTTASLLWAWHPWRPIRAFSFSALRSFFRFGSYVFITEASDAIHTNLYAVLISKLYSVHDVGLYDRAQRTQMLPSNFMMTIITRVAFSVFSSTADDKEKLRRGFRKAQQLVMFINIPLMVSMIILAEPIIMVLFGKQWLECTPILQVLGLVGAMWPLHALNISVLKAQGRSDLFFNITMLKKAVTISLLVAASAYGVMAIAWSQVVASVFGFIVNAYYSRVFLNYGAVKQIRDLMPAVIASVPAGCAMWLIPQDFELPASVELPIALTAGAVLFLLTARVLRIKTVSEIIWFLRVSRKPSA